MLTMFHNPDVSELYFNYYTLASNNVRPSFLLLVESNFSYLNVIYDKASEVSLIGGIKSPI